MRRKAITPLISTVLLLVFAIGLGTLVMSWGNSSYKECDFVEIAITELAGKKQICLADSNLKAVIENNGYAEIRGMELVMVLNDAVIIKQYPADIKPGEIKHLTMQTDISAVSKILKIRLIPQIDRPCVKKRVEIEKIGECEDEY